ncbi:hypothetical protein LPJ57_002486 [Coemansia sp. RSA 486]|nr:hypothetical protein LPJ57_002486 [Coemansia sp. RSA 486]
MDRQRLSHESSRYAPGYTAYAAGRDDLPGMSAVTEASGSTSAAAPAPRAGPGYYGRSHEFDSARWSGHTQRPSVQNLVLSNTQGIGADDISSQDLTKTGYSLLFSGSASARPLGSDEPNTPGMARANSSNGFRGKWSNSGQPGPDQARNSYPYYANVKLPAINSAAFHDSGPSRPSSFSMFSKPKAGSSSLQAPIDTLVQNDGRFEDYSNRAYCFINNIESAAPHVHNIDPEMLPPSVVLPLETPRIKQDLPFWRPPPVLQRDPHYNRTVSSMAPSRLPALSEKNHMCHGQEPAYSSKPTASPAYASHGRVHAHGRGYGHGRTGSSPKRSPASQPQSQSQSPSAFNSSDSVHSSLSSALLAISNSHYQQQMGPASKTTLPSIHSLASRYNSDDEDRGADSTARSSAPSSDTSPMAPSRSAANHRCLRLAPIATSGASTNARESMSIACLVDSQESSASPTFGAASVSRKRSYGAAEAAHSLHKLAHIDTAADAARACFKKSRHSPCASTVITYSSTREEPGLCPGNQVVITCYHASVAQKSYGGEKRFLCPPPAVLMCGEGCSAKVAHGSAMVLSVVKEAGESPVVRCGEARPSSSAHAPLECQTSFNERNVALFKSLHVTGMQKAKSFRLRLDLLGTAAAAAAAAPAGNTPVPYASLESGAVAIISKPSKKTAKARNQSTCIRGGALVSLFNRINSQTFRTKYLNVDHHSNRWVAQSHNWSPFSVEIVGGTPGAALYYGTEIVLVESHRNFRSPPMVICKVERGRLVPGASSPVSQMQKVALQLKQTDMSGPARFLMADSGHYTPAAANVSGTSDSAARLDDAESSPELTFEPAETSRLGRSRSRDSGSDATGQELDDAFCWTIVGISAFTCSYSVQRDQAIGSVPRITGMSLGLDGKLSVVTPRVDLCSETLLVDNQPLYVEKTHVSDTFSASLPLDIGPGALVVRRSDGALFHTGWALRQNSSSNALELVECNLHI